MKRSQVISLDFIIAIFIFIGVFVITLQIWQTTSVKQEDFRETNEIYTMVEQVSEYLMSRQGNPSNWHKQTNLSSVSSIGFKSGNELSFEKINTLDIFPYSEINKKLGVLGKNHHFALELFKYNGGTYVLNTTYGNTSTTLDEKKALSQRQVIVDGEWAILKTYIWTEKQYP